MMIWSDTVSAIHTERCRNRVPTCLLPSQHAGKDARTLAQVGVCFSQLGEGTERQVLISKECKKSPLTTQYPTADNNWLPHHTIKRDRQKGNFLQNIREKTGNEHTTSSAKDWWINGKRTYCTYTYLPQTCNYWKSVTTIKSLQLLLLHSLVPLTSLNGNLRRQS